jgi:hypothetical protein
VNTVKKEFLPMQRSLAKVDRLITKATHAQCMELEQSSLEGEKIPRLHVHMRGGKRIGVKSPDGGLSIMQSKSIFHKYNAEGRLIARYKFGKPPEGYTILSEEDLQRALEKESWG